MNITKTRNGNRSLSKTKVGSMNDDHVKWRGKKL